MRVWEYGSKGVNKQINRIKSKCFYGALQNEPDA
jgi:hypothetical protein